MKKVLIYLVPLFLLGCASSGGYRSSSSGASSTVSEECRLAKAEYGICNGGCIASTPGGLLKAMSVCGNKCRQESFAMRRACR